jgi:hypothetical protein
MRPDLWIKTGSAGSAVSYLGVLVTLFFSVIGIGTVISEAPDFVDRHIPFFDDPPPPSEAAPFVLPPEVREGVPPGPPGPPGPPPGLVGPAPLG